MTTEQIIASLVEQEGFVRSLARSLVGNRALADDLAQDTWVAALNHPPRARASTRGWLAPVMRNQLRKAVAMLKSDAERLTHGRGDEAALLIPGNEDAFDKSSQRVEWSLSDGYWSEEDALALRLNLPKLTASQQEQLILTLIPAINSGAIVFDEVMHF